MMMTTQMKVTKMADLDVVNKTDNNVLVTDTFLLNNVTVYVFATRNESATECQSQLLYSLFSLCLKVSSKILLLSLY